MFAQCLTNPLLKMEAAVRELNAIESEFQQASVADDVRLQQLFCHSAMDGHVVRKFGWGNKQSLDVLPRERGVDMARMLRSFWKSHYKLKHMKLVVVAPKKLRTWCKTCVAALRSRVLPILAGSIVGTTRPRTKTKISTRTRKRAKSSIKNRRKSL